MADLSDLEGFLALRAQLGIVHHVPGRIRLRLGPAVLDRAADLGLDRGQVVGSLGGFPGVRAARINPAAASVVIEYDPRRLEPARWETLVLGEDDEAVALVLGLLAGS